MDVYNKIIDDVFSLISDCRSYGYDSSKICEMTDAGTIILSKESLFEYGAQPLSAVNSVLFTDNRAITDKVILVGKEISETDRNMPYARISVISLNENEMPDDGELYKNLKDIEFAKYHIHPANCLIRQSPESKREQIRISRTAVKNGISFEKLGCAFINEYKKHPLVKAVTVIFITDENYDYKKIAELSSKANVITESLNKILDSLEINCDTCELKSICDEVEGLRKLHFGKER